MADVGPYQDSAPNYEKKIILNKSAHEQFYSM